MAKLEDCIGYVLENEGGFTIDSGGPTNFGITIPDVIKYRGKPVSTEDMKNLSKMEATEIYRLQYWQPMKLDEVLNQNVATAIFDTGVNRGIGVAVWYAQRVAGANTDGVMGQISLLKINATAQKPFIQNYEKFVWAGYLAVLEVHPTYEVYRKGWLKRAERLLTLA